MICIVYLLTLIIVTIFSFEGLENDQYVAVCVIAKDEPDIAEWLEYHRRLGISKFYIFDHNSSVPLLYDILPHVRSGLVEYRMLVGENIEPSPQHFVFEKCLKDFGSFHSFMAFIDIDEFIVIKNDKSISEVLKSYELYGGLVINWRMFGSSGRIQRPSGGVLRNYNKCGNDFHIKSIVRPAVTEGVDIVSHSFRYKEGFFAVDPPLRAMVYGPANPGYGMTPPDDLFDTIYINHYAVKSIEDYQAKVARGRSDQNGAPPRDMALFERIEAIAVNECEYLAMPEDKNEIVVDV